MLDTTSIPKFHHLTDSRATEPFTSTGFGLEAISGLPAHHPTSIAAKLPQLQASQPLANYTDQLEAIIPSHSISRSMTHAKLGKSQDSDFKLQAGRDVLTGLSPNQTAASSATKVQGAGYSRVYGYGLVDAAKAVAWSAGYPYTFRDVPNWGGGNVGNDIVKAQEAWNAGYTGRGVTVAVIDSGVDINHADLNDNVWRNPGEIAGDNVDNDRNGYVDDLYGWNFGIGQNNNDVRPGTTSSGQSHGTHVAGIIAAEANGFGTTGTAPNARIMALRLGNVNSGGRFTNGGNLAQAIYYAVNNGARVINMSLGWNDSPQLRQALAYAASRNVITVSASGNEALVAPGNPAKYATNFGVSVGAIDNRGESPYFSNWAGSDSRMQYVVAPGVNVYSTLPNGQYGNLSGTSMAAPYVAGVAALMLSANPNLTHAQIRYILTQSAA